METLAIILAIIFVGGVIDAKNSTDYYNVALTVTLCSFLGALAIGIYVAVTG